MEAEITDLDVHAATAELLDALAAPPDAAVPDVVAQNFLLIDQWARGVVQWQQDATAELEALRAEMTRRRMPRERRTGAAARINPDDIRVFYGVLAGSLVLPLITFAASFQFQAAFGAYTPLPEAWWWVIPAILELPLLVLTPMVLIFRRRKESSTAPWITMCALATAAGAINFSHVAVDQGLSTWLDWIVALFFGAWPFLTLVLFKFFARLAVKPERPEPEPRPAATRKTTTRKASTR